MSSAFDSFDRNNKERAYKRTYEKLRQLWEYIIADKKTDKSVLLGIN